MKSIRERRSGLFLTISGLAIVGSLFVLGACASRAGTPTAAPPVPSTAAPRPSVALPSVTSSVTRTPGATRTPVPATASAPTLPPPTPTETFSPVATLSVVDRERCGSLIAYVRDGGLWLMHTDGSSQRELAPGAKGRPAWSPDGRSLAYQPDEEPGLRIADLSVGQVRTVAVREGCFASDPAWSPDGSKIAFRQVCGPDDLVAGSLVFLDTASGSLSEELLTDISSPTWSPDGAQIAVIQGRAERFPDTSILLCARDGTGCSTFSDRNYIQSIAWSPNGEYIAAGVVGDPADTTGASGGAATPKVRLLPLKGGQERELTGMEPAWGPDSQRLLRTAGRYGLAIYVVDVSGAKYQELAPGASPAWQRCGSQDAGASAGDLEVYRGWSIYDTQKQYPFEVRFASAQWVLNGSVLRHKQIPGCDLNLNPMPTGAEMCEPPTEGVLTRESSTGVLTRESSTWDWKAFRCPKIGLIAYHTSVPPLEYGFVVTWDRQLSQEAAAQCRIAAETVIGTFDLVGSSRAEGTTPDACISGLFYHQEPGQRMFSLLRFYHDGMVLSTATTPGTGEDLRAAWTSVRTWFNREKLGDGRQIGTGTYTLNDQIIAIKQTINGSVVDFAGTYTGEVLDLNWNSQATGASGRWQYERMAIDDPDSTQCELLSLGSPSPTQTVPETRAGRILFLSNRDRPNDKVYQDGTEHEMYVMDADGSNQTRLSTGLKVRYSERLSVSPDGTRILIDKDTPAGQFALSYVSLAEPDRRVKLADGFASSPVWSPDGRHIAYCAGSGSGSEQVIVMNADGSNAQPLTVGPDRHLFVDWSPDGRQLAFMRDYQLYVMNADGTEQRLLLTGFVRNLAWSPDGTMIAFEGGDWLEDQEGNGGDIWIVNSDGSDPRNLTNSPDFYDAGPAWSPDSAAIIFSSQNRRVGLSKAQIAGVGLSIGQVIYLTDVGDNRAPVWAK